MRRAKILGTGHYAPDRVVTNHDLEALMDTNDAWIQQRTGIKERRWISEEMGVSDMGKFAADQALEMAGLKAEDIDAIVFATISGDYQFPGSGVLLGTLLGRTDIPAVEIRNACSGFIYAMQVADSYIRSGLYDRVLLVGAEVQSTGMDISTAGRDISVIFGDGAGALVLGPSEDEAVGILASESGSDGRYAEELMTRLPGSRYMPRITAEQIERGDHFPQMNGREVFKHAVRKMPASLMSTLQQAGYTPADIDLFIPHQANLRISEMVQRALKLPDEKVYNNIERFGNTTAASIPIAMDECMRSGRLKAGDLFACAAFGAGFTWGSLVIRM